MFEALSGTEREQHAQYQLLKETLDSVTQELSHKHAQVSLCPMSWRGTQWIGGEEGNNMPSISY